MDTSASCYRHQRKNKKKEELDCDGTYMDLNGAF